jgi:hypothetical protein
VAVADSPPTLEYAAVDTQSGVTCERRPDGGVSVTVPGTDGRYLSHRLSGAPNGADAALRMGIYAVGRLLGRPVPPRAVIELTPQHLAITEPDLHAVLNPWAVVTRRWPTTTVDELRPNRYSKGIYVRVPGKDNFDLLTDLNAALIEHVGRTLAEALARLREARPKENLT